MLEGLPPHRPTCVMRLATVESAARALTEMLGELFDPTETAVAAFEAEDGRTWLLEAYFTDAPDQDEMRELVRPIVGDAADGATFETLDAKDWVRASLEGLKPVRSGRFLIHGAHDRATIRSNDYAIEIEAALAFGTGHHGTTVGCLQAWNDLIKARRFGKVLDVGAGTGVLAIAAARTGARLARGTDIDAPSVRIARENATLNGARAEFVHASGLGHQRVRSAAPYDLVFANILAPPLVALAQDIRGALRPGGVAILSGLLRTQERRVLAAYRSRGFRLLRRIHRDAWATLVLERP